MQPTDKERKLNYYFWKLPALERLKLAIKFDLVYDEMADKCIDLSFFQEVVKSANRINFTETFLEYIINNYYPDKKE